MTIPITATPADVERVAATTGYSRLPTTDADGELVGYLHLKDILEDDEHARRSPVPAERRRPLLQLDVSASLSDALALMQETGSHIAQVHDQDGAPLGIAMLEDLVQRLIGELRGGTPAGAAITEPPARLAASPVG